MSCLFYRSWPHKTEFGLRTQRGKVYINKIGYYGVWSERYQDVQLKTYLKKNLWNLCGPRGRKKSQAKEMRRLEVRLALHKLPLYYKVKKEKKKNLNSDTIEFFLWINNYFYELFHFVFKYDYVLYSCLLMKQIVKVSVTLYTF